MTLFFTADCKRVKNRSGPTVLDIRGQTLKSYGKMVTLPGPKNASI